MSDTLDFRLVNDLAGMADLAEAVERFATGHRLPAEAANALYVCVDEAVSNAIAHGYPDGALFDPLQAPPPDLSLPLEKRPIGGLGIHLIRNLMDELSYVRRDGRNLLKLVKNVATT